MTKIVGQDEDIGFEYVLNKERVTTEYLKKVKKIWNSQRYACYKVLSRNIFAVPILTPTFGIIQWTKEELEQIDIKTRKLLTTRRSFHKNSDIDRLYSIRKEGGRGLNSIVDTSICRTVSLDLHLKNHAVENKYLTIVAHHEKQGLVGVVKELMKILNIFSENGSPQTKLLKNEIILNHYKTWLSKVRHDYLEKTTKNVSKVDKERANKWLFNAPFFSHVEGYLFAIQEEEIHTNDLKSKRDKKLNVNPKCRLCHAEKERIQHIIAACPKLSTSMYLPVSTQ